MTTYILHGGDASAPSALNQEFFTQFTESVDKDSVNILLIFWAQEEHRWQESFDLYSSKIRENTTKNCKIKLINSEAKLYQEMPQADTIYFHGGTIHLVDQITQPDKFKEGLNGKTYIGCSMGAYLVSSQYMVSNRVTDKLEVKKGLGLLPLSIVCHWDIKNMKRRQRVKLLREHNSRLPILTVDEQKYVKLIY